MPDPASSRRLRPVVRRLRRSRTLRRAGVPAYQAYRRLTASGDGAPIIINSVPKSGTHLVSSMLENLPGVTFSGRLLQQDLYAADLSHPEGELVPYDARRLRRDVGRLAGGTYAFGHLYLDDVARQALTAPGVAALFAIRDPRDVCVSLVRYVQDYDAHPAHRSLTSRFATFEERLEAVIRGFPGVPGGRGMTGLGERLAPYVGWTDVLPTFRFEDLVTRDVEARHGELVRLLEAIGHPVSDESLARLTRGIGNERSATFDTGTTGSWEQHFTTAHRELVAEVAGPQVEALGYSA